LDTLEPLADEWREHADAFAPPAGRDLRSRKRRNVAYALALGAALASIGLAFAAWTGRSTGREPGLANPLLKTPSPSPALQPGRNTDDSSVSTATHSARDPSIAPVLELPLELPSDPAGPDRVRPAAIDASTGRAQIEPEANVAAGDAGRAQRAIEKRPLRSRSRGHAKPSAAQRKRTAPADTLDSSVAHSGPMQRKAEERAASETQPQADASVPRPRLRLAKGDFDGSAH
jgi:hypothetical protein